MSNKYAREVLPIGLLTEGKECLVVGGGKIAARKASHLLEAKAAVTIVAPAAIDEIAALAAEKTITWHHRNFVDSDVAGKFIVFAATDDKVVNKHIIACCHEQHSLCCSVDGNWTEGDFVTPATLRKDGLTISVLTGGKSCRRSRLVKDNLSRHIEMIESADLVVIGTSHQQLTLKEREPYHLVGDKLFKVATMCEQIWGIHEFALLNTCNRVELYAVVSREAPIADILKRIMTFFHLTDEQFYIKRGFDAFGHMSIMLAGLYSQTPGENHIVAQTKNALDLAVEHRWAEGLMRKWLDSALHVSKRIRTETHSMLKSSEIEDLSLSYLSSTCGVKEKRVIVAGTGMTGESLIQTLSSAGANCTWCYHINKPVDANVNLCSINELPGLLKAADIIIFATSSPDPILDQRHAACFDPSRQTTIIDLSAPRNVAPELGVAAQCVTIMDLDDLKHWYRREEADMDAIMRTAKGVVDSHIERYEQIIKDFQSGNTDK